MSATDLSFTFSANHFLDQAVQLAAQQHPVEALNQMDLAISLASNKPAYILRKIEFFYQFQLYSQCTDYIILNFSYLYHHSSLKEFAQVLHYYHQCTQCLTEEFNHLLLDHRLPLILSTIYIDILQDKDIDFMKQATECFENREYVLSIQYATLAMKQNGECSELWLLKAKAHEILGQVHETITAYKKVLSLPHSEDLSSLFFSLATALEQVKQFADAYYYYGQALSLSPDSLEYHYKSADCLFKWGKHGAARRQFRMITKRFPSDAYGYLRLGELYEISHHKRLSQYYYKQAQRIRNHKSTSTGLMGRLLGI